MYADDRDKFSLVISDVNEATAKLNISEIKEEGKQGDLDIIVKPEDSLLPGDDNF